MLLLAPRRTLASLNKMRYFVSKVLMKARYDYHYFLGEARGLVKLSDLSKITQVVLDRIRTRMVSSDFPK